MGVHRRLRVITSYSIHYTKLYEFSGIRENISPTITAVATILILFSVALLVALELLRRRNARMRGTA